MAGTLTISTLSDGTNSTSSTNCIQGSAKAWACITGSTGAIQASYNVSSVTRATTGKYVVNFSSAFADAKYTAAGYAEYYAGVSGSSGIVYGAGSEKTASLITIYSINYPNGSNYDAGTIGVVCFR